MSRPPNYKFRPNQRIQILKWGLKGKIACRPYQFMNEMVYNVVLDSGTFLEEVPVTAIRSEGEEYEQIKTSPSFANRVGEDCAPRRIDLLQDEFDFSFEEWFRGPVVH